MSIDIETYRSIGSSVLFEALFLEITGALHCSANCSRTCKSAMLLFWWQIGHSNRTSWDVCFFIMPTKDSNQIWIFQLRRLRTLHGFTWKIFTVFSRHNILSDIFLRISTNYALILSNCFIIFLRFTNISARWFKLQAHRQWWLYDNLCKTFIYVPSLDK